MFNSVKFAPGALLRSEATDGHGKNMSTFFGHYMTSTPCGDFASGNCKICSQDLRILHESAPNFLPVANEKRPHGRLSFSFAPGARFELATNALHRSLSYLEGWTISSPVPAFADRGCEALPLLRIKLRRVLPCGIVSTPSTTPVVVAWLGIAHSISAVRVSPNSPHFST